MTREAILKDKQEIEANIGKLSIARLYEFYEKYMNGADAYLCGVEFDDMIYGYFTRHLNLKYCSCQTDHAKNEQYLRFRPHGWGAQEIATREDAICFGSTDEVYKLYTCNTKKGYNSGYCFERAVFNFYGMGEQWEQNNLASTEGGDICLNGEEIQMKFVEKNSLATVTSTSKILRRIEKILEVTE